jgi:integrase
VTKTQHSSRRRGRIKEVRPGSWTIRVYFGRGSNGSALFGHQTVQGTRRDAERALTVLLKKKDEGLQPERFKKSVGERVEECITIHCQRASERTRYGYQAVLERYLKPETHLWGKKLVALTPQDVQRWLNQLAQQANTRAKATTPGPRTLSGTTVRQARSYLRLCLTKAERLGYVTRNVAKLVELPPLDHREMRCFTPEQAQIFLDALDAQAKDAAAAACSAVEQGKRTDLLSEQRYIRASLYALFVVLIDTGIRPGEAAGLKWEDLDGSVLRVRRALKEIRPGQKKELGPTKTGKPRSIPLGRRGRPALARLQQEQNTWRVYAEGIFHNEGFIFSTSTGSPIDFQNVRNQHFKPTLERLGLPDIRLYDLRHTAATILLKQKVSPKVVQERLGHSTIMLTMDTYSHVLEGMQEAATEAMDLALGSSRFG